MNINNFKNSILDIDFQDEEEKRPISSIHIHVKQVKKNKYLTTVVGFAPDLDLAKIVKYVRKTFNTNAAVIKSEDGQEAIQVFGDQRDNLKKFFIKYKVWEEPDPQIVIHGA
jgi:translation initiation factor SUI1